MSNPIRERLRSVQTTAVHLEMRDTYGVTEEDESFAAWVAGDRTPRTSDQDRAKRAGWLNLVRETVGRGVTVRRARIVSTPVSDYISFEHSGALLNIEAGELVRWLPRSEASDLLVPGNDFWCFDRSTVVFNMFTGSGAWADPPMAVCEDTAVATRCAEAFEAVWARAVPHEDFAI